MCGYPAPSRLLSEVRFTETIASDLAAPQQVGDQSDDSDCAQHVERALRPVEKIRNDVDVPTEVVSAEAPDTAPEDRAGHVVRGEDPPMHLQNPGDDSVQLPESIDKSSHQDDRSPAPLEKAFEMLLANRVYFEFGQRGSPAPAPYRVSDTVASNGRGRYEQ